MEHRNCPLCYSNEATLFMKQDALNNRDNVALLKCKNCQFVYSQVAEYEYQEFGEGLDLSQEEILNLATQQNINKLMESMNLKANWKVLDFGAGIGITALYLKEILKCDVYVFEKSELFQKKHKELGLQYFDESVTTQFDLIILKDVLESRLELIR